MGMMVAMLECRNGHPRTEENTRWRVRDGRSERTCRECARDAQRRWQERSGELRAIETLRGVGWTIRYAPDGQITASSPKGRAGAPAAAAPKPAKAQAAVAKPDAGAPAKATAPAKPEQMREVRVDVPSCPDCGKVPLLDVRLVSGVTWLKVKHARACGCPAGSAGAAMCRDYLDLWRAANPGARWECKYPEVCGPSPTTLRPIWD